ncbi:MAG: imidazole glycerol phosphate synthase subunit HisH [Peptostreptococcaceae bacterium]|nr:imidazole glycerol phosphate synthase subunit HisH [Peptostreptococcaceae bacterium]
MIAIVDYGMGNLKNVQTALENIGVESIITSKESDIDESDAVLLPGVGAFRDSIKCLNESGLVPCIRRNVDKGKILIGICLGMQLLFDKSYEDGEWEGLGFLKGDVVRFDIDFKVPHMGWNNIIVKRDDPIGRGVETGEFVYFVHSYYAVPKDPDDVVFSSEYGVEFPAIVRRGNVIGAQFHPEKSGETGYKILKNLKEMIEA